MTGDRTTLVRARKVICLDHSSSTGEWILVAGDRIAGVGSGEPPSTELTIETEGFVIPGLIDAHVHLTATGILQNGLDLTEARSVPQALDAIGAYLAKTDANWVLAGNFDPGRNPDARMPSRGELDAVSEGRSLFVSRADGHSSSVNSRMFEALDLNPSLPGIDLAEDGTPSGILSNKARYRAGESFFSRLPPGELKRAHEKACQAAMRRGVTSVHEMSQYQNDFEVLVSFRDSYPISVRPYLCTLDIGPVVGAGLDCIGGDLFLDGSLGSHTAALSLPYSDRPDSKGFLYHADDEITDWYVESSRAGLQTAVHAIGDAAIEQAIRCMEAAFVRLGPEGALGAGRLRHRIEHCELVSEDQIERAGRLGMVASVQPAFDHHWGGDAGMYAKRLGERAQGMNPLAVLVRKGIRVAGGSDSTVTPLDPFLGMQASLQHHNPAHRLSAGEALRMFTIWAAEAGHEELERGSLEPGKRADFCVLDRDPAGVDPAEVTNIRVLGTWVGGNRHSGLDSSP